MRALIVLLVLGAAAAMGGALRASQSGPAHRAVPLPAEAAPAATYSSRRAPSEAGPPGPALPDAALPDAALPDAALPDAAGRTARSGAGEASPGASPSSEAVLVTDVRTVFYDLGGSTEGQLLAQLRERGPRWDGEAFFGLTQSEYAFTHGYRARAGRCEVADTVVRLRVVIALPRWQAPPEAPPALRQRWGRFAAALAAHEEGHRRLAERGGERLREGLARVSAPTCEAAGIEARRLAGMIGAETQAAHERYDRQTGHGRTEGAVWP